MKNKRKIFIFISVLLALTVFFTLYTSADFGDFGGDSDFGGDGGGDWGDSDGTYSSGGSISKEDMPFVIWLFLSIISLSVCLTFVDKAREAKNKGASNTVYIIFAVIFGIGANLLAILFIKGIKNAYNGNSSSNIHRDVTSETLPDRNDYISIDKFKDKDRYFTENTIKEFTSNFYIKHQQAITSGDFSLLSPYCDAEFFKTVCSSDRKEIINPTVLSTQILGYKTDNDYDLLFVLLTGRQKQPNEIFVNNIYTLRRKSDISTKDPTLLTRIVCPNCGAPVDEGFSSKCKYCDSIIDIDPTGWKIVECKLVSNNFIKPGGPNAKKISVNEYVSSHPDFDVNDISSKIKALYLSMQEAWGRRNIMPLQKYFTDVYFKQMNIQLEGHIKAGRYPHCEDITVNSVTPLYFTDNFGSTGLTVRIAATVRAYYTDSSGKIISGNRNLKTITYEWDLIRKNDTDQDEKYTCPGCGAILSDNAGEYCSYCGSVIRKLPGDWSISTIRAISQETK